MNGHLNRNETVIIVIMPPLAHFDIEMDFAVCLRTANKYHNVNA